MVKWWTEVWDRRPGAGFKAFKGHLMAKVQTLNFQPKQNITDHTTRHDPSQVEVPGAAVNKPFK